MPILNILLILVVVGFLLWVVNTYIPMDRKIKSILNLIVVIGVIIWLLRVFGIIDILSKTTV
ncbi:MAG: Thivi_2564 family membrane protein [Flavobacterium sp.]